MRPRIWWLYSQQTRKTTPPKKSCPDMRLNFIWWWDTNSRAMGSVECSFYILLPGPLWPRVVVPVRLQSICLKVINIYLTWNCFNVCKLLGILQTIMCARVCGYIYIYIHTYIYYVWKLLEILQTLQLCANKWLSLLNRTSCFKAYEANGHAELKTKEVCFDIII